MKNKLETYVDFPVDDLDLSMYVAYKNGQSCTRYVLYAISNHYGSMGGGHYTAFVHVSDVTLSFLTTPQQMSSQLICTFFLPFIYINQ